MWERGFLEPQKLVTTGKEYIKGKWRTLVPILRLNNLISSGGRCYQKIDKHKAAGRGEKRTCFVWLEIELHVIVRGCPVIGRKVVDRFSARTNGGLDISVDRAVGVTCSKQL